MVEAITTQGPKGAARVAFFFWRLWQRPLFHWRVLRRALARLPLRECWEIAHAAERQRLIFLAHMERGATPRAFFEAHARDLSGEAYYFLRRRVEEFARDAGLPWGGDSVE